MRRLWPLCVLTVQLAWLANAEYPAVYPPKQKQTVAYSCEDSYIHLSCKKTGGHIRILLANYGRFSLVVCNTEGIHKDWNTQCSSDVTMSKVRNLCDDRPSCTFKVDNQLFGNPCLGTKKYLEVRYICEQAIEIKNQTQSPLVTKETTTTTEEMTTEKTADAGVTEELTNKNVCGRTERESIYWPPAVGGVLVQKSCSRDKIGTAWWQCGEDGQWVGDPDVSDCVSKWLHDIQNMLDKDAPAEAAIERLNSRMRGATLGSGDLKKATSVVIPSLVTRMKSQMKPDMSESKRRERIHSFNKEIVKTGSGLLDDNQRASWESLDEDVRKVSATSLIVSLEQMALEMAATINPEETVSSSEENIVMEVSVIRMAQSVSPDNNLKLPRYPQPTGSDNGQHDFTLPLDGFAGITLQDDVTVTYLFYNNLESLMTPRRSNSSRVINSNVMSASVMKHSLTATSPGQSMKLKRPMNFTLSHKEVLSNKIPVCAYWKYNTSSLIGGWSEDGCHVVESNGDYTTCQCDHLTNFAVLMDIAGTPLHIYHQMSLQAITYVGCSVSIICLLMCFISFSIFRNLQSDRNTIHKNLVLCLLIAELLFLFGIGQTHDKLGCSIIAAFLHFFFLTSFSWMCLEGIQLYFMLIEVFEAERSRVRWFYTFGYGVPLLIVGISAAVDHTGYGTDLHCWLRTDNYFILSFVIPAGIVILINIVMLSIAVYMMCRHAGVTASAIQSRQKGKLEKMGRDSGNHNNSVASDTPDNKTPIELPTWLKGSAVLVVLLGLTWMFGFLYVNEDSIVMAYIFTILNSLQGLFIFIFHCFMDRKVKKEWRRAIYKAKWLPVCCRVNLGGYNGNLSSPPSSSSGPQNYFLRFWSSRKRKRSTSSATTNKHRRSDLDSFLRSDTSSGCTQGTGVNRYSNQSDKLLPNGLNIYSAMPTHYEGGVNGDLSVVDGSVIDSEYVTEYCQHAMQVSQEKRRYSSGSEDLNDEERDNISRDSVSKHRLSFLSTDSALKINSENEEGEINYAVLDKDNENEEEVLSNKVHSESDRNLLNDILTLYETSKGKNGTSVPCERICNSQDDLDSKDEISTQDKCKTKSAPNLKNASLSLQSTHSDMDTSTQPLLGSLPDINAIGDGINEATNPSSKSEDLVAIK